MRIRRDYGGNDVETEIVEREIIGGSSDNSEMSFGYIRTDDGIRALPSPVQSSPAVKIYSPYRVERISQPGAPIYVNQYGQFYAMTPDGERTKSTYVAQIPVGQFFTGLIYFNNCYLVAVAGSNSLILVKDNVKYLNYTMPRYFRCGCFHCGRIFARDSSEPYTVRWSGTAINDWTEGPDGAGYIVLDLKFGEIMNMYELGDKVIILRKYGITVLRALGDTRNFSVDAVLGYELTVPLTNPYAVVCAGKLYFSTEEDIYSFDGSALRRVDVGRREKLSAFANPQCYANRYVYFECMTDKSADKHILEYDLETGQSALFCANADTFWRDEFGCHFFRNNNYYSTIYGETYDACRWVSVGYDLGSDRIKTLKEIYVDADGSPEITVTADGVSRTFGGTGAMRAMLRGRKFVFEVGGNADVRKLSAKWEVSA